MTQMLDAAAAERVQELAETGEMSEQEVVNSLVQLGLSDVDQLGIEALALADAENGKDSERFDRVYEELREVLENQNLVPLR